MAFCIPIEQVRKLKMAAKEGKINLKGIFDMNSKQRREYFTKTVGDRNLGKMMNEEFERAMVSKQKDAFQKWANDVLNPKTQKPQYSSIMSRIDDLNDVLNPKNEDAFLEDLVAKKMGAYISPDEAKQITKKAEALQKIGEKHGDKIGNPLNYRENLEYFTEKSKMDNYLQSLTPSSKIRVATGTIGRGAMLTSPKSVVTNIIGNTANATGETLSRSLANLSLGFKNADLSINYFKNAVRIHQKTGYDMTRMLDLGQGVRTLGEEITHAEGKGITRFVGRLYEDVVFKTMLGTPDVAFSAGNFAHSAAVNVKHITNEMGLKGAKAKKAAREIMEDSMSVIPKTEEGQILRNRALIDAQVSTYQDDSALSKAALKIRGSLNDMTGDWRAGDLMSPFVKTPANVIKQAIQYGGGGIVTGAAKIKRVLKATKGERMVASDMIQLTDGIRDLVKAGVGISGAYMMIEYFKPEDYVGQYDWRRRDIEDLKNVSYNALKIGDKYWSMDYFGPLATTISGLMNARQLEETGVSNKLFEYATGTWQQLSDVPGFKEMGELYTTARDVKEKKITWGDYRQKKIEDTAQFVSSRVVPSIVSDLEKIFGVAKTDPRTERYVLESDSDGAKMLFGEKIELDRVVQAIPVLRSYLLPEKKTYLGEQYKKETLTGMMLFGARRRTAAEGKIVEEFSRLDKEGTKPPFVDLYKSKRIPVLNLKSQLSGEEFYDVKNEFGKKLGVNLNELMQTDYYMESDNELKKRLISDATNETLEETLLDHGLNEKGEKMSTKELEERREEIKTEKEALDKISKIEDLRDQGKIGEAENIINKMKEEELDVYKNAKRKEIQGSDSKITEKNVTEYLNSIPKEKRGAELKTLIETEAITDNAMKDLYKTNEDFRNKIGEIPYEESPYKALTAQSVYEKIGGNESKIKSYKKSDPNLYKQLNKIKKYDKAGIDYIEEGDVQRKSVSKGEKAEWFAEYTKNMSASERLSLFNKLSSQGIIGKKSKETVRKQLKEDFNINL